MEQWVKRNIGNSGYRGTEGQGNICHSGKMGQNELPILKLKCKIKSKLRPCIEQFRNPFSLTHFSDKKHLPILPLKCKIASLH